MSNYIRSIEAWISDQMLKLAFVEHRLEPYYRDAFDRIFQPPLVAATQALINAFRANQHLGLAEERLFRGEQAAGAEVTAILHDWLRRHYAPGAALRAGNTKTYGVVRAEFEVLPTVPAPLRQGLFAEPHTYRAWVRLAGPGPFNPPDSQDGGILSIGIKVMGVPGPKLLDDEQWTQDFTGLSAPMFTTPNIMENVKIQRRLAAGSPLFYFINPLDPHLLNGLMQALYARMHPNPVEVSYWSCGAYLCGAGQAIQYLIRPRDPRRSPLPRPLPDNFLRDALVRTLQSRAVEFDFLVQRQTDAHRMPIEDAGVIWPTRLSPWIAVARLRIPAQTFDSPAQRAFAGNLVFNPWHSLAAHRPLGSNNRARKTMYRVLAAARQAMNGEPHIEPTGDETF